ncbi:hypothetical protein DL768_003358 [Monosporascus sp. mg162]|nr:hypothetical protein DL768_003358 [Monosporascus sp. mg162]
MDDVMKCRELCDVVWAETPLSYDSTLRLLREMVIDESNDVFCRRIYRRPQISLELPTCLLPESSFQAEHRKPRGKKLPMRSWRNHLKIQAVSRKVQANTIEDEVGWCLTYE